MSVKVLQNAMADEDGMVVDEGDEDNAVIEEQEQLQSGSIN